MGDAVVYVASKTRLAPMWQGKRLEWGRRGITISSTWIDEAGPGESDMTQLWPRIVREVRDSHFLIACHEEGDAWKGAYAEIGMALMIGIPIYFVGRPQGTLHLHPAVSDVESVDAAVDSFLEDYCGSP